MKSRRRPGGTIAALLACAAAFGFASVGKAAPAGDITGLWVLQRASAPPRPTLTPDAQALSRRRAAATAAGYRRSAGDMLCEGEGLPGLMMTRAPFEVMQGFGRISVIFETARFSQPRTLYLREQTQPDDVFPNENGHSIGHWEGATLMVDTIGFNGHSLLPGGVMASDRAHMVERISLSPDRKVMTDLLTLTDPATLARPWTMTLKYDRAPPSRERVESFCYPDVAAFKALDLNRWKDADPFVARMVDPETRPTDPALKIGKPNP